jgi:hypothetical protein
MLAFLKNLENNMRALIISQARISNGDFLVFAFSLIKKKKGDYAGDISSYRMLRRTVYLFGRTVCQLLPFLRMRLVN